jgi:hypothetical protein
VDGVSLPLLTPPREGIGKCRRIFYERSMAKAKQAAKGKVAKVTKASGGAAKPKAKVAKVAAKASPKAAAKPAKAAAKPAKAAAKPAKPAKAAAKPAKAAAKAADAKAPKGTKAAKVAKGAKGAVAAGEPKRRMGLRGAAPWAARHAAKHAAEARARAAEPPPPGSARATLRTPANATDIKERIAELHRRLQDLKALKRNVAKNFFPLGVILQEIETRRLYEAKGFSAFDAFLERETELGRTVGLRIVRIVKTFNQQAAESYGLDRLTLALAALDAVDVPGPTPSRADTLAPAAKVPPAPPSSTTLPLKPPGRF